MGRNERKKQVHSVFCPNCGIPRNAICALKGFLHRRGSVPFYCHSCGFKCIMEKVTKAKTSKKENDDEMFNITGKDMKNAAKGIVEIAKSGILR